MMCYAEIDPMALPQENTYGILNKSFNYNQSEATKLWQKLSPIVGESFKRVRITRPSHIWPSFKILFGGKE